MAKIKTLRKCTLFRNLSYRDLAILAPHVREESSKTNDWLAEQGKLTAGLIIIQGGKVQITLKDQAEAQIELGPGEFFGELSLVNGDQTRCISAKTLEPCEYLRIPPTDYRHLLTHSPEVAGKVAQGILESMSVKLELAKDFVTEMLVEKKEKR